jgi:hypothetical protein
VGLRSLQRTQRLRVKGDEVVGNEQRARARAPCADPPTELSASTPVAVPIPASARIVATWFDAVRQFIAGRYLMAPDHLPLAPGQLCIVQGTAGDDSQTWHRRRVAWPARGSVRRQSRSSSPVLPPGRSTRSSAAEPWITFPVLIALGYQPLVANVSNNIGLVPGSIAGAYGYRRRARRPARAG